jgi:nucleoside-diphosphate-sugar epimerase
MKVLLTGNNGYIGTVLTEELIKNDYEVIGFDTDYFYDCKLLKTNPKITKHIKKDIRDISEEDLDGIEIVVHLAGLANDPLGEFDPKLTHDINFFSTVKLAKLSKKIGVKRFIYASSQSMYGISDNENELEEDNSKKNPITAYARTKWEAEKEIKQLSDKNFIAVMFRPSTVFGASARLRCDIVYNSLVACAFTTKKIEILSDGTPWRPVIHVKDLCNAFISGIKAPSNLVNGESFNVGIQNGNYTVRELAEAAQRVVPGSDLVFLNKHSDPRTYKVSFKKILTVLKDYYNPVWTLEEGGKELVEYFKKVNFRENNFRSEKVNRLLKLEKLIKENKINNQLNWINEK